MQTAKQDVGQLEKMLTAMMHLKLQFWMKFVYDNNFRNRQIMRDS